ncbi:DUF6623 family protein [Streptomyces violaceusniger]
MWTHGHAVQTENPSWAVRRTGNAGHIARTGEQGWCHFAIPTPVIVSDRRLRIDSALLRFFTGEQATIDAVHIWDGDNRIAIHENLSLRGANRVERFQVPDQPEIRWGVGVSVHLAFGVDSPGAWADFNSAGADFF